VDWQRAHPKAHWVVRWQFCGLAVPLRQIAIMMSKQRNEIRSMVREDEHSPGRDTLGVDGTPSPDPKVNSNKNIDYQNRKRNKKEAKNKMLHSNGKGNKPKNKKEKEEKEILPHSINKPCNKLPDCPYGDKCKFSHEVVCDIESQISIIQKPNGWEIVDYGYYYYERGEFKFTKFLEDVNLIGVDSERKRIKAFTMFGRYNPGNEYTFISQIYKHVYSKLGVLPDEPRNYRALDQFVYQIMKTFPSDLIEGIVQIYMYRNTHKAIPSECKTAVVHTRCSLHLGILRIRDVVNCEAPIEYKYNGKWLFSEMVGFSFQLEQGKILEYPKFNTELPLVNGPQNKRNYFSFSPIREFRCFKPNAFNLACGLKRYLAAREDEFILNQNQLRFMGAFDWKFISDTVNLCGATYQPWNSMIISRKVHDTNIKIPIGCALYAGKNRDLIKILDSMLPRKGLLFFMLKIQAYLIVFYGIGFRFIINMVYVPLYYIYRKIDMLNMFILLPHPKRLVYTFFVNDERKLQNILNNSSGPQSKVKWEVAKVKIGAIEGLNYAIPRLFASFGEGALTDLALNIMLKMLCTKPLDFAILFPPEVGKTSKKYVFNSFKVVFVAAQSREEAELMCAEHISNMQEGDTLYVYMSDDSFMIIRENGTVRFVELDIKSCDSSHEITVYASLRYLSMHLDCLQTVDDLLKQLAMTTMVQNPDNKKEFLKLTPRFFFLYSGSKLTTVANNIASILIAYGIYQELCENGLDDLQSSVVEGAKNVGYEVSYDEKSNIQSLTFLKRSFTPEGISWLTLGPILRSFGCVDGEPNRNQFGLDSVTYKSKDESALAEILIRSKLDMLVGEPVSPMINSLRLRCGLLEKPVEVTLMDYQERYGGEVWEWNQLFESIENLKFGDYHRMPILERIYAIDYGVDPVLITDRENLISKSDILDVY